MIYILTRILKDIILDIYNNNSFLYRWPKGGYMKSSTDLNDFDVELLNRMRGKKIIATIKSVSRSGMSRTISFYFIDDNTLYNCTYIIAEVVGYKQDKYGHLKVNGCGMDMIFSVLSNFNYAMAKRDTGKTTSELLGSKEFKGKRIYDNYFIDANNYQQI